MRRRHFMKLLSTGAAAGVLPQAARAEQTRKQAFHAAAARKPWLTAFRTVGTDALGAEAQMSGRWPEALRGTLYRNGPAQHEIGDYRYGHWFDSDGMLQAYRITDRGVHHSARLIETQKLKAERRAGRALYPGFGSCPPNAGPVTRPDAINPGNISVLAHHGELLALWEAGSAWRMDAASLATNGIYAFSEHTAGAPFSAHPRVEPDGTLWNFGYASAAGKLVLWHIDRHGALVKSATVEVEPMTMPHDFVVTARHLVILLPPLHYRPAGAHTFLDAHRWAPADPTRVLVVDKNDFSQRQWLELPAQWVFHYGNAWESSDGVIRFDGARFESPMALLESFRAIMGGATPQAYPSRHHAYAIDTRRGTARETPMFAADLSTEFPAIDPRVSCRRNERLICLSRPADSAATHPLLTSVSVYDRRWERLTSFRYPDHVIPEEHLFVPKPGSAAEGAGWVLGTVLDCLAERTTLNVFDVEAVDAGPIATATLPYAPPLGLHGQFVT